MPAVEREPGVAEGYGRPWQAALSSSRQVPRRSISPSSTLLSSSVEPTANSTTV